MPPLRPVSKQDAYFEDHIIVMLIMMKQTNACLPPPLYLTEFKLLTISLLCPYTFINLASSRGQFFNVHILESDFYKLPKSIINLKSATSWLFQYMYNG